MDSIQVCTIGLVNVLGVNFSPFIDLPINFKIKMYNWECGQKLGPR